MVSLSHWIKWCGSKACNLGWLYVRQWRWNSPRKDSPMRGKGSKYRAFLAICSWSHLEFLQSQTPHFIHLSENIFLFNKLLHLHLLFDFTKTLSPFTIPVPRCSFIHFLPGPTYAPPSQTAAYPPHLAAFRMPCSPLFLDIFFFNLHSPNSPTGYSCFS